MIVKQSEAICAFVGLMLVTIFSQFQQIVAVDLLNASISSKGTDSKSRMVTFTFLQTLMKLFFSPAIQRQHFYTNNTLFPSLLVHRQPAALASIFYAMLARISNLHPLTITG